MDQLPDRIAELFKDRTVLISGATGFVGKALLEKLLRVTDVKRLYLLIRKKKGKSHNERVNEIFNNISKKPNAMKKCVPILGDVSEIDLGINNDDRQTLVNEIDFIIHSAATTRFDHTLKEALFIHVSTAYVNPKESILYEKIYDPPADPHEVLNSINWIKEDTMGKFTKTDSLLQRSFPGWCNSLQGPMGLFVGAGKGVIRSMYMDSKSYANFIPVDCTVSGIMAAAWNYLTFGDAPQIYNLCVPEKDFKITWEEIILNGYDVINNRVPFNNILWYPGGTLTKSKVYNNINFVLFQLIPALFIDMLFYLFGYKPITKHLSLQSDVIDVKNYLADCCLCVRRSILKETDDMLPAAKRKHENVSIPVYME
ncbi:hypothetical protein NQ317_005033 [Molorchus minor]|uniref:Fatty acyl-CoA reductase n=1 Tax=Molorchus minor TaxID=1323400 RepID=A0ABQ9JXU7_9CUCU|nr:hypothetical protein NQ317_005033 [Molorchus minor]